MSEDIVWEEPPSASGGGAHGKYADLFDELRKHPGEWARIVNDASASLAGSIKQGKVKGCEPGEFDAVARSNGRIDKRCTIYARYVGTNGEHKDR